VSAAYVDTSAMVSIALQESARGTLLESLRSFETLFAANLLEAELRAALHREGVAEVPAFLDSVTWIFPVRAMSSEMRDILQVGYLRGADLWHLATALYASPNPGDLTFISLDAQQRKVAALLGFPVAPAN
jgi:predicted nucleic acid-binding protein